MEEYVRSAPRAVHLGREIVVVVDDPLTEGLVGSDRERQRIRGVMDVDHVEAWAPQYPQRQDERSDRRTSPTHDVPQGVDLLRTYSGSSSGTLR